MTPRHLYLAAEALRTASSGILPDAEEAARLADALEAEFRERIHAEERQRQLDMEADNA